MISQYLFLKWNFKCLLWSLLNFKFCVFARWVSVKSLLSWSRMQQLPRWVLVMWGMPSRLPWQWDLLWGSWWGIGFVSIYIMKSPWKIHYLEIAQLSWFLLSFFLYLQCIAVSDVCFKVNQVHRCVNTNPGFHCLPCPPRYKGSQPYGVGLEVAKTEKQVSDIEGNLMALSNCHLKYLWMMT